MLNPPRGVLATLAVTALAAAAAGCTATSPADRASSASPGGAITVFAAASLTETFTTLGDRFRAAHPGITVTFNFAASSALATQITQGAPADVFASASEPTMEQVVGSGATAETAVFARNTMEIAVPPDNPARITRLSDLARPDVSVAVCQPAAPCGVAARTVFANAALPLAPVTEERDVKAALAKVQLGEVDAAVVYVTDVRAAGDLVTGIEIPAAVNASTSYPIAVLSEARNPSAARAFVDYVLSAEGAAVLAEAGFAAP